MGRIRKLIESLDLQDLNKMKKDLDSGGINLKKLLDNQILEKKKKHDKVCSVCMNSLDPTSINNFTLVFGPHDFRKKASFCGTDCMQYFMDSLKEMKENTRKRQMGQK